ncbi:MATE family efflux transporter [Peptoniphilus sp. KCTC 25270]|uniref:MATE family efflux transporter n=1 Tax=Peptoniphilus sp. KCTC 25270 TaxID=2897414 RepID=UPI001E35EEB5|nr:MATE family efflux transporter [Peptoniphilus sp. KCTC 25270]MCD1147282.1 MATE family efflux transporter [Peptoniphilus sp. KCTC 25270]
MEKSLGNQFIYYVSRNVMGMIALSCYILADTFFVAQALGTNGLTALNLAITMFAFMNALGLMLGVGGASRYSILLGKDQPEKAKGVFSSVVKFGFGISLIFVIFGMFFSEEVARFLGADEYTFDMVSLYLKTIWCFAPLFICNYIFNAFVRNDGNPNLAMMALLVGSFTNIVLDYIFLFPLKMGIFGAAFATSIAPLVGLLILSRHFWGKGFGFLKEKFQWKIIPDAISLGSSAFIIEISSGFTLMVFNFVILDLLGNAGVAAYGIVANIALVAISIFNGVGQGIQPLVSYEYGRRNDLQLKGILKLGYISSIGIALFLYLISIGFVEPIVSWFNSESNEVVEKLATQGIFIYFLGFFFAGINSVSAMYLSSSERPRPAFLISLGRGIVIIVPMVLFLSRWFQIEGVWWSYVATEGLVTLLLVLGFLLGKGQGNKKLRS